MQDSQSRVIVHMAASLDGFIARKDGSVDWMETSDHYPDGQELTTAYVESFLESIDCYVMGSRTFETALQFESQGSGWAYGDKPVFVLANRPFEKSRDTIEFFSGDLAELINNELRPRYSSIWVVGGAEVCSQCISDGLADEIRYTVLPVLIGDGIPFFTALTGDTALHLTSVDAYQGGNVELCYEIRRT